MGNDMFELTHKNCAKCGLYLHREKFYNDNRRPDGLQSYCKKCDKKRKRKRKREAK